MANADALLWNQWFHCSRVLHLMTRKSRQRRHDSRCVQFLQNMQDAWKFGSDWKIKSHQNHIDCWDPHTPPQLLGFPPWTLPQSMCLDSPVTGVIKMQTDTMSPGLGWLRLFTICHKMIPARKERESITAWISSWELRRWNKPGIIKYSSLGLAFLL